MAKNQGPNGTSKSAIVRALPLACMDEATAVVFLEARRWGGTPSCPRCRSTEVYQMRDRATGARSKRWLWRCEDLTCKKQFTVRVGTVFEDSKIPLRHWCFAFWGACTHKKGVSALQIARQTGLSYESALFMMHRVRYAMTDQGGTAPKLEGIVEADETWVGGKAPADQKYENKTPVVAIVQRDGPMRAFPVERVTSRTLRSALTANVDARAKLMIDELSGYPNAGRYFLGGHETVNHSRGEYARGAAHINTAESFFAILKRGVYGTWHSVSKKHGSCWRSARVRGSDSCTEA